MKKEKVGKLNEAIYLTNLDDLCQITTNLQHRLRYTINELMKMQKEDYDEKRAEKLQLFWRNLWHICDVHKITYRLITSNNKQESVLMVPVHSDLCCYIGKGYDHHVIQITEMVCNRISKELAANKLQQQNYTFTDLGTLHQAMINLDNEFVEIIDRNYNSENWTEKRHEMDGWVEHQERCQEVKRVADNLISDNNHADPVLLIKAKYVESYCLGCGTELYVIQVSSGGIYSAIENVIKKNITV